MNIRTPKTVFAAADMVAPPPETHRHEILAKLRKAAAAGALVDTMDRLSDPIPFFGAGAAEERNALLKQAADEQDSGVASFLSNALSGGKGYLTAPLLAALLGGVAGGGATAVANAGDSGKDPARKRKEMIRSAILGMSAGGLMGLGGKLSWEGFQRVGDATTGGGSNGQPWGRHAFLGALGGAIGQGQSRWRLHSRAADVLRGSGLRFLETGADGKPSYRGPNGAMLPLGGNNRDSDTIRRIKSLFWNDRRGTLSWLSGRDAWDKFTRDLGTTFDILDPGEKERRLLLAMRSDMTPGGVQLRQELEARVRNEHAANRNTNRRVALAPEEVQARTGRLFLGDQAYSPHREVFANNLRSASPSVASTMSAEDERLLRTVFQGRTGQAASKGIFSGRPVGTLRTVGGVGAGVGLSFLLDPLSRWASDASNQMARETAGLE